MSEHALVTGGSGFIGSHLVDRLIERGDKVTVYDLVPPRQQEVRFVKGDLLEPETLGRVLVDQDIIYHLAGNADVRGGTKSPGRDLGQNLIAMHRLLECMRHVGLPRLMFVSSAAVYGEPAVIPTPEDVPCHPTSLYGGSKLAAEAVVWAYCHSFGLRATIVRPALVLGPRYRHGVVADIVRKITLDSTRVEVLGTGKQRKSYVDVIDVVDGIECALSAQFESGEPVSVFNIGGDCALSVDEVLDVICERMGVNPVREYTGKSWPGDPSVVWLDCSKLRALGWAPRISATESIARTVKALTLCATALQ